MFSIVIPLWNKAATVQRTLSSVLSQTFGQFEVLVVDDGSTDHGPALVDAFTDSRITLIRQHNSGGGEARNTGVRASRNPWIAFLDADDLWLPGHLQELDLVRTRHPEAGLIGTAYWFSGEAYLPSEEKGERTIELIDYFASVGAGEDPLWVSSAALRKDVWEKLGGFAPRAISTDSLMWARVALDCPVAVSRRRTAVYLLGTGGVMDSTKSRFVGNPPRSLSDISPTAALAAKQMVTAASESRRKSFAAFVDRYVGWALMSSVAVGDIPTILALRKLYIMRPPRLHRAIIWTASVLPAPAARRAYRIGLIMKAALRRMRGSRAPAY